MASARLGLLQARLAGGETGLYEEEFVKDEPSRGRRETLLVSGKVNLVYSVVQVGQPKASEEIRGQRIEDAPGFVEGTVDEGPHPARVYALVGRIDRHEPASVGGISYRVRIVDELQGLGRELQSVPALHLARDEDPSIRDELVQE